MMISKPTYYDKFHCIGGSCSFTCCQEWKIAVDEATNAKWKSMLPPEGTPSRRKNMSLFTQFKDGGRVIALEKNHKCPFLNPEGLCRVVISYGEENISHTCHVFPREIHHFADRSEYTLMPSCPEAIDLLEQEDRFEVKSDTVMKETESAFAWRNYFVDLIQKENYSAEELFLAAFFIMLNLYRISYDEEGADTSRPWVYPFSAAEEEELLATVSSRRSSPVDSLTECNELFLDLIENYRKEGLYRQLLADAAELAEEIEGAEEEYLQQYKAFGETWAVWQPLVKKLLAQEFYADLLIPAENAKDLVGAVEEADLFSDEETAEHMLLSMEWIGMEYVMIRHMAFLKWISCGDLTYENLRERIVLVGRMMGYEDDDIYEYLVNSFESPVWDWGYMAMLFEK